MLAGRQLSANCPICQRLNCGHWCSKLIGRENLTIWIWSCAKRQCESGRGCNREFLARKSKKHFLVPRMEPNLVKWVACARAERDFLQYPSLANFIEHHVHQNWPPKEKNRNDPSTSSWHWQRCCMGASLVRATTLPKSQVCAPQQRTISFPAHSNQWWQWKIFHCH